MPPFDNHEQYDLIVAFAFRSHELSTATFALIGRNLSPNFRMWRGLSSGERVPLWSDDPNATHLLIIVAPDPPELESYEEDCEEEENA